MATMVTRQRINITFIRTFPVFIFYPETKESISLTWIINRIN